MSTETLRTRPVRYQFDQVFALNAARTPEPPAIDAPSAETQARAAWQDGFEKGRAEAEQDQCARTAAALERLAATLAVLEGRIEAETRRIQAEACRIAHAVAVKLAGALVTREPLAEIESLLARTLGELQAVPHLVVRINETLAGPLNDRLAAQTRISGFEGRVIVMGEPDIAPGDARIEWADGGIVRDMKGIEAAVEAAVSRFLAARDAGDGPDHGDDGR